MSTFVDYEKTSTIDRHLLTFEDMRKSEVLDIFDPHDTRPDKLHLRVKTETSLKYREMRKARAKIAPRLAEAIDELIDQLYQQFKQRGA